MALFALLLIVVVGVLIAVTVRSRTRRGASVLVAVGGFSEAAPAVFDREPFWDVARLIVGVLMVAFGAFSLATFHQRATLDQLYADASAHRMHDVTLSQDLYPGAQGTVERRVSWKTGHERWEVTVEEQRGPDASEGSYSTTGSEPVEFTTDDIDAKLRTLDPGVRLQDGPGPADSSISLGTTRFYLSGTLHTVATVAVLSGLLLVFTTLVGGPEPWRATRWAWFWLLGSPLGWLAFCLLSGPTPQVPAPRRNRRLTGGVAFVISIFATPISLGLPGHLARYLYAAHR